MKHYTIPSLAIIAVIVISVSAIITFGYLAPEFQGISTYNPTNSVAPQQAPDGVTQKKPLPKKLSANITVISEWSVYENQAIGLFFKYPNSWTYPDLEKTTPPPSESYSPDNSEPAWTILLGKDEKSTVAPYTLAAFAPAHTARVQEEIAAHEAINVIGHFEVNTYETIMYNENGKCRDKKAIIFAPYASYILTSHCDDSDFTPNNIFESLLSSIVIEDDIKTLPTLWPEIQPKERTEDDTTYTFHDISIISPDGWNVSQTANSLMLSPFDTEHTCETSYCSYMEIRESSEMPSISDIISARIHSESHKKISYARLDGNTLISSIQKSETCDHYNARLFTEERVYELSYGCYSLDAQKQIDELLSSISTSNQDTETLTEE